MGTHFVAYVADEPVQPTPENMHLLTKIEGIDPFPDELHARRWILRDVPHSEYKDKFVTVIEEEFIEEPPVVVSEGSDSEVSDASQPVKGLDGEQGAVV